MLAWLLICIPNSYPYRNLNFKFTVAFFGLRWMLNVEIHENAHEKMKMKIQIADCSNSMCRFCALCVTNRFHLLFDIWATGAGCYWCQWKFSRKIIGKWFPFNIFSSFIISASMPVYCVCVPCDRLKEKCSALYSSVSKWIC